MGTFHAICVRILRVDGKAVGVESGFVVYDYDDPLALVEHVMRELNIDAKQHSRRAVSTSISAAKADLRPRPT